MKKRFLLLSIICHFFVFVLIQERAKTHQVLVQSPRVQITIVSHSLLPPARSQNSQEAVIKTFRLQGESAVVSEQKNNIISEKVNALSAGSLANSVITKVDVEAFFEISKDYPELSRSLGEQGDVLVQVRLLPKAQKLKFLRIVKSSGFERLDKAAIASIHSAVLKKSLPRNLKEREQLITISFQLIEN